MQSLRHAQLKAARALEHLGTANLELENYYQAGAYSISRYERPDIGRRFLSITLKNPSDRTYLLVGDFAHNLRSALDHVVHSLVIINTNAAPASNRVQWPTLAAVNEKLFQAQTNGISSEAAAIIESLQPYRESDPKKNLLWQLHMLDIIDKHRRVAFEQHYLDSFIPGLTPSSDIVLQTRGHTFEIGFPINWPSVEMQISPRPEVRFGSNEDDVSLSINDFSAMHRLVTQDILPRFTRFFKEEGQSYPSGSTFALRPRADMIDETS